MGLNTNPYSNTPIKNLEYIQNKALVIAPFEITKSGLLDTDLMLDTPGTITMYFFRKTFNDIDKEPTAEQFKTVGTVSDINTKLGLDISASNISSSSSSSYYLGFAKISVIFKYDKNTGIRTIEKDTSLSVEDYIDISIDSTVDLTTEDYFVICNVTKNTKATNSSFTESASMDFLFMIPSSECRELNINSEFDILDINNKVINLKKCDPSIDILFNDQKIDISKMADFFNDKTNVATYLFNDNLNDENGLYNASGTLYGYEPGMFGKAVYMNATKANISAPLPPDTIGISMWFNIHGGQDEIPNLFSANKNNEIFRILPSIPHGCIYITNKNVGTKLNKVNVQLTIDTWYHIYMDNNKMGIYLNGIYYPGTSQASFDFNKISALNTFRLSTLTTNDNYINGSVEQLRLFNRVLTETEIKSLYLNSPTSIILNSSVDISKLELTASVSIEDQTQFIVKDYETDNILTTSATLPTQVAAEPDFFGDKTNVATYLFNDNLNDENGLYNASGTRYGYEPGKFGKAIFSTDTNTRINLGNPHKNSKILSVSFWLKWSGVNKSMPISLGDSDSGRGQSLYFWNNYVGINSHNGDLTGFSSNGLSSVWKHFVIEFNSGKVGKIWLDGVKQNLNHIYGTFSAFNATVSDLSVYIGLPSYGAFGSIDQVRLFNRSLTPGEIVYLQKETKKIIYNIDITTPTKKLKIETSQGANYIIAKTWIPQDPNTSWYRIHPVMNISDHTTEETTFNPKFYLGSKYQRNLMEVLAPALKSKRTISNLKDMYLVDDLCIQTLKKINILLENNQMIKFSERLYNLAIPLREKLNADLILEYLSAPVSGSSNNDIVDILKTSLMEDYNFTQEEIDNLNDNLNTFKSRARIALSTPVIQGSGLDQVKFSLPKTFIDNNRSQTEKKNLLVFGTDAGFNKFGLSGYSAPYSNISKRDDSSVLNLSDLTNGLTTLSKLEDVSTIKDVQLSYGDYTQHILFENGNLYACRYVGVDQTYKYNRDGQGFTSQSFPLKLINTNVKSMYCGMYATFIIDNNNDVWALGGLIVNGSTQNLSYDIYGINSTGNYIPNWTKVFSSTPENTPKKIIGIYSATWLLMESGEVFCTGDIPKYYTFDGIQKGNTKTWTSITTGVKDIDCGGYHIVYTMQNGDVYVGDQTNENGLTTQSNNTTTTNLKVLKILTNWIPTGQNITQIECTEENIYYLLSNGEVYGVGLNRGGQMQYGPTSSTRGVSTPKKLYSNVKRIIPQLFGRNNTQSALMVELNTGEIKANGNTYTYKFGYYVDYNIGVTTPVTLFSKVDKIFLTELTTIAIINGVMYLAGYNLIFGENTTNNTFLETKPLIALSDGFKDILTNYKQQIPFTYIPLSTDIKDINDKPVFETLTNITGFYKSEIIIDIPNVL